MFVRIGLRQSQLLFSTGVVLTMTVIAGCGDSVPASPNPIPRPPARPGFVDLHNPETLVKAKAEARAAKNNPKGKVPGKR